MMRIRDALIDLFCADETSRRAVEQTLLDWREERRCATTGPAALLATVRGVVSLARACLMVGLAGFRAPQVWSLLIAIIGWPFVIGVAGIALNIARKGFLSTPFEYLLIMPANMVVFMLVPAAFAGLQERRAPLLSATVVLFLTGLALTGIVVPEANQLFRESVFFRLSAGGSLPLPIPGINEHTLIDLMKQAYSSAGYQGIVALQVISSMVATALLIPVALLLSAAIRIRVFPANHWAAPWLSGTGAVLILYATLFGAALATWSSRFLADAGFVWWLANIVGVVVTTALMLGRQGARPDARTRNVNAEPSV